MIEGGLSKPPADFRDKAERCSEWHGHRWCRSARNRSVMTPHRLARRPGPASGCSADAQH